MIRVSDRAVLTAAERGYALLEVVEDDIEVTRISAGCLEFEPGSHDRTNGDERDEFEAHQRRLLRELVDCGIANAKTEMP